MSCLLAIDQSTSATKAVLFDLQGRALDSTSRPHRQHYPQPGWVEHDAEEIWQNVLDAAAEVCGRNPDRVANLAGVSLSNQRETVVALDRATGRPLCRAIVWQCRRSAALCDEFRAAGHEGLVVARTGLKLDPYFSGSKVAWLVRNDPTVSAALTGGSALLATIDAYLVYRLTRGGVFATDCTNASRTLLFDLHNRAWDDELCGLFGAPRGALPEVREPFDQFGETTLDGLLPRPVPICGVMGDSQASLFAQRCYTPGDAKATFGTGTSVLLNVGAACPPPAGGAVAALAWAHRGLPTYAWEGLINYSAATIAWLKDQLGLIQSVEECEALAAEVPDNGGVYLVPAFAGLSAPHWRPEARAALIGMSGHTRRAHVVRAALESVAYQVRDVLDAMRDGGAPAPATLNADGGPTRNRLLMQLVADMTGVRVEAARTTELSALGAAMAGLVGLGVVGSIEDLRGLPRDAAAYDPVMPRDQAEANLRGWRSAVQRVL